MTQWVPEPTISELKIPVQRQREHEGCQGKYQGFRANLEWFQVQLSSLTKGAAEEAAPNEDNSSKLTLDSTLSAQNLYKD